MVDPEIVKIRIDGFVQIAKWISYFILLGGGLSLTVSIMRLTGGEKFKVGQVEFPLSRFVYVVSAFTAVHAFLTFIFIQRIPGLVELGKANVTSAWEHLISSEAFVFYNMRPRALAPVSWPFQRAYVAQSADTAFWFSLFLATSLFASLMLSGTIPTAPRLVINFWDRLAIACVLTAANWIIGSQWAIAASSLAL